MVWEMAAVTLSCPSETALCRGVRAPPRALRAGDDASSGVGMGSSRPPVSVGPTHAAGPRAAPDSRGDRSCCRASREPFRAGLSGSLPTRPVFQLEGKIYWVCLYFLTKTSH